MAENHEPTIRDNAIYQAATLIHQYGTAGGRNQADRIDLRLDDAAWTEADQLIDNGNFTCQWCNRTGAGDCNAY